MLRLHRSCPRRHTHLTVLILVLAAQLRLGSHLILGVSVIVYYRLILILIIIFSHLVIVKEILAIVMNLFIIHSEEADGSCRGVLL